MHLPRFTRRTAKDRELEEEIESHLLHLQDEHAARGLPPQ